MLFIDTWGWMAMMDRRDSNHEIATAIALTALETTGICTTNFVLSETITFLFSRHGAGGGEDALDRLLDLTKHPEVQLQQITPDRFQAAIALRRKYSDKPKISFADLTSMAVMKELRIMDVLTKDRHFANVNMGFHLLPEE